MTSPKEFARQVASRRAADAPVVLLALDAQSDRSLQRQVYDGLREAILACRLPPGARLPSTRALASDLGVSRTTVVVAFDQLRAEGYVTGRRGGGTRVHAAVPDVVLDVRPRHPDRARPTASDGRAERGRDLDAPRVIANSTSGLSARGRMLVTAGERLISPGRTTPMAFRLGVPAIEAFPAQLWARLSARRWRNAGVHLGEAHPAGEPALRAAIAEYVSNARGARCSAEQVVVVSGTQQALDLAARVLLDVGDAVWVEDPGYPGAQAAFAAAGARVIPVPVDREGLDVAAGERAAFDARMAYVTPSHQFPLGAVMSAPRRLALLAWARRARSWIVEDDYDSEFRYAGRPLPCLQGLEAEQRAEEDEARVLYIGTFNKSVVPGLRLGYLVVPGALVDALRASRASADRHPSTFEQGALTDFLGEGHYARHVRRLRTLYAERQAALVHAAESQLEGLLTLVPDAAGLHLVGWLKPGISDLAATRAALAHRVEVTPLSRYTLVPRPSAPAALLLSFAGFDERAIRAGARRLRTALRPV